MINHIKILEEEVMNFGIGEAKKHLLKP